MKAISIKEPWAGLILSGRKTIETRTWSTDHRGDLLLCASKHPESSISGYAFAIAKLINCVPMRKDHERDACCEIYPDAVAWIFYKVTPIKPFPVKGKLRLFEVDIHEH